jgi:hypothetical protein
MLIPANFVSKYSSIHLGNLSLSRNEEGIMYIRTLYHLLSFSLFLSTVCFYCLIQLAMVIISYEVRITIQISDQ